MSGPEYEASTSNYAIRAVDRVCDILDVLANSTSGVSLSEVAEAAKLPKSSTFRYLAALEGRRYVERDAGDASYHLGLAFRPQNTTAVERLTELAAPIISALRDRLEETVNLGVLDGAFVVHTAVAESPHMMRLAARVGERGLIHCTALGKVICAALPEDRVRSILEAAGMPRHTEKTIQTADAYVAELARVAELGYGLDDEENQPSGRCVAVRIDNIGFPAGLSVSAPLDRFPEAHTDAVVAALREAAAKLSALMAG